MKRLTNFLLLVFLASSAIAQPVFAAEYDPYYNAFNNIIFYDDPTINVCASDTANIKPTTTKVDNDTLGRINQLKSVYQEASAQTGIRWEIFAALDYREDNNSPTKSMLGGEPLGTAAVDSGRTPNTKLESIIMGSEILKGLAKGVYGVDVTQSLDYDKLQKAFIVYNRGYSYKDANQSPDTSPYVMNQYDEAHKDMTFPSIPGETLAGRKETGRYGAMTVFANLTNSTDLSGSCFGAGVGAKVDYTGIYPNLDAGTLSDNLLCTPRPSQPSFKLLKGPACDSFIALNSAYQAAFGKPIPLTGGYRTAQAQIDCYAQKPGICAPYRPKEEPPEHTWGTAIDFGVPINQWDTTEHDWVVANGPNYGWFHPTWAQKGGSNPEPWHFQYYFVGHDPTTDKLESLK